MAVIAATDYELLTSAAGIVRRERGLIELGDADAGAFLQGQVTNDVEALADGEGCYAALLTHKGRIRTDMRILRRAGGYLVDSEPIGHPILWKTIQTYGVGRQVGERDVSDELALLSLIGPDARTALGDDAPPAEEHRHTPFDGGLAVSTDVGIDLVVPRDRLDAVIAELGLPEASFEAAECVRIEAGRPRLGIDIGGETIPEEAGLNERAVSFTKGCYVGQETVARLHYRGRPNRHLVGLRLARPAATGDVVAAADRTLGSVGSACESPRLGPIALAVLRTQAQPGDRVAVGADGDAAEVVGLPFP
jgi:folate-binding protein YgfZ